ncbi:MAG: DUF1217 domain-containing protein [Acetobacteraceae bacterium]
MVANLGYLTNLYASTTKAGGIGGLLGALYGTAGRNSAGARPNPVTALLSAETSRTQGIKTTAADPQVKRAVDRFAAGVASAKTVQDLLSNPAVMQVLLTANGLGDQTAYAALARKALTSDTGDPASLANQLTDTRWKAVAKTYDFAHKGLSVLKSPGVIAALSDAYAEISWRKSLDAKTPGLSNALTFRAQAAGVTSVYQILGDPALRTVVTTALAIPLQIAFQPLEAQEMAITSRLDVTQLKDPKFVEKFVQRYLIAAGTQADTTDTTSTLDALAVQSRGLIV